MGKRCGHKATKAKPDSLPQLGDGHNIDSIIKLIITSLMIMSPNASVKHHGRVEYCLQL